VIRGCNQTTKTRLCGKQLAVHFSRRSGLNPHCDLWARE